MIHVVKLMSFIGEWWHGRLEFLSNRVLEILVGLVLVYSGLVNIMMMINCLLLMIHHEVLVLVLILVVVLVLVLREYRGRKLEYLGVNQWMLLLMTTISIHHES